jgi:hypothetical protein
MLKFIAGALGFLSLSVGAFDQTAPFGFSWGSVDKVPTPSMASREDNVTLLMYRRDQLPRDELPDTEEIVLEICKKEGLQQIVWISRFLSETEKNEKLNVILSEGTRRYGKAEVLDHGIISWSSGRTLVTQISDAGGLSRIVMVSTGPGFDACSEEHKSVTGHTVSDHWMQFLPGNTVR